jgi:AcrR family transcriptional regulator
MSAAETDSGRAGYRRSAGSPRGEARRRELLNRVTGDLAVNGLVDFSLRRAARAAGTTHKVLLYYFDSADDLLAQAIFQLREQRVDKAMAAIGAGPAGQTLADRVRAIWPVLLGEEYLVLAQAIGLTIYDPARYGELGRTSAQQYMRALVGICPPQWPERRKAEVSEMIMAAMQGFVIDSMITGTYAAAEGGLEALARALDREEAAG